IESKQIVEFRFISKDDLSNDKWLHWSRKYEYPIALDCIAKLKPSSIHNTSCGGLNTSDCLHLTFCNEVSSLCSEVIHSDIWDTTGAPTKPDNDNFKFYDITQPYETDKRFDMVMNISVLEELSPDERDRAFHNLYSQVKEGGVLFLTFDYPQVDLNWIEKLVGEKIKKDMIRRIRNWKKNLSVILLIISK
ncbi:MAG: class I SAM-dependent methyltransferase, partial [Candidatus Brocadiaceae bacterium]|nr:class I SAM-dependent methyltransferase [Candidatus Brocadiaceae bacterium]